MDRKLQHDTAAATAPPLLPPIRARPPGNASCGRAQLAAGVPPAGAPGPRHSAPVMATREPRLSSEGVMQTSKQDGTALQELQKSGVGGGIPTRAKASSGDGGPAARSRNSSGDGAPAIRAKVSSGDGAPAARSRTPSGDGTPAVRIKASSGDGTSAAVRGKPFSGDGTPIKAMSGDGTPAARSKAPSVGGGGRVGQSGSLPPLVAPAGTRPLDESAKKKVSFVDLTPWPKAAPQAAPVAAAASGGGSVIFASGSLKQQRAGARAAAAAASELLLRPALNDGGDSQWHQQQRAIWPPLQLMASGGEGGAKGHRSSSPGQGRAAPLTGMMMRSRAQSLASIATFLGPQPRASLDEPRASGTRVSLDEPRGSGTRASLDEPRGSGSSVGSLRDGPRPLQLPRLA